MVKVLPAQTSGAMERMVELLPQMLESLNANGEKKGGNMQTQVETFVFHEDDMEQ